MSRNIRVLAVQKLGTAQASSYLTPLVLSDRVERLHIIREARVRLPDSDKISWHEYGRAALPVALWRMWRLTRRLLATEQIDLVVAFNPMPYGLVAWCAAKLKRRPVTLSLIGDDFDLHCHAWYGFLLRGVLRRAAAVTGTGERMVRRYEEWGISERRASVLPHSIATERFASTLPPSSRQVELLYVGDLIRRKRVDDILRAASRVAETRPDLRVVIVGNGPEETALQSLATQLDLNGNVRFAGRREDTEIFYADARIVVVASAREGLPFVLLEGMSAGCVPISTKCGTVEDLIASGLNGFLVDVGDWESMADRILELLTEPEHLDSMSRAALEVRDRYSWDAAIRVWDDIFRSLEPDLEGRP